VASCAGAFRGMHPRICGTLSGFWITGAAVSDRLFEWPDDPSSPDLPGGSFEYLARGVPGTLSGSGCL
jgi:hypothetical protein